MLYVHSAMLWDVRLAQGVAGLVNFDMMLQLQHERNRDMSDREYPREICCDCGNKYGRWPDGHVATFYHGKEAE